MIRTGVKFHDDRKTNMKPTTITTTIAVYIGRCFAILATIVLAWWFAVGHWALITPGFWRASLFSLAAIVGFMGANGIRFVRRRHGVKSLDDIFRDMPRGDLSTDPVVTGAKVGWTFDGPVTIEAAVTYEKDSGRITNVQFMGDAVGPSTDVIDPTTEPPRSADELRALMLGAAVYQALPVAAFAAGSYTVYGVRDGETIRRWKPTIAQCIDRAKHWERTGAHATRITDGAGNVIVDEHALAQFTGGTVAS